MIFSHSFFKMADSLYDYLPLSVLLHFTKQIETLYQQEVGEGFVGCHGLIKNFFVYIIYIGLLWILLEYGKETKRRDLEIKAIEKV